MRRRAFLEGIGLGAAGTLIKSSSANAITKQRIEFAKGPTDHPLDTQIAVKAIYSPIIHSDVWEGPCRPTARGGPEKERSDAQETFKMISALVKTTKSPDYQLLEPVMMDFSEDFWIRPEKLAQLEADRDKVDVYLVSGTGMHNYTATVIAETFKKPIVLIGSQFIDADAAAGLKSMGLEGHAVFDFEELNHLLSLLKTRKAFEQTNILIITDRDLPPIPVRSCIRDMNMLKDKFGIGSHFVSYREFAKEMDEVINNKEISAKAEDRAQQLIKNAEETHIDKQYVKRSFEFYYAVKNLMQKYGCNAFTVECFELCASRLAEKYKITPCLVHTLLKDEGIASACELDLNALLSMRLLMSVAKKSSFMGNPASIAKDQLYLYHSVPGIKMAGYDKPDLAFDLRHFVESGWGTKVMIDFTKLEEKTVTLARLDPFAAKIYIAKGEIIDCTGFRKGVLSATRKKEEMNESLVKSLLENDQADLIGCTLAAHIKVPEARECMRKLSEFGSHLSMVYGDYTREIHGLADMMGFDVVHAT
jgi:hypothetical protein